MIGEVTKTARRLLLQCCGRSQTEMDGSGCRPGERSKEAVAADVFRLQLKGLVKLVEACGSGEMPPCTAGRRTCSVILLVLFYAIRRSYPFFIQRHDADTNVVTRSSLDRRFQRVVI